MSHKENSGKLNTFSAQVSGRIQHLKAKRNGKGMPGMEAANGGSHEDLVDATSLEPEDES